MAIKEILEEEQLIKWRRYLHQHPELSFNEVETATYLKKELAKLKNIEVTSLTENSVIATLIGELPGKTIALRADIDALPIDEQTDLSFKSVNAGVMHACGHDAHTAMLLGAVTVLSTLQAKLKGTIKFIFQPAEEVPPGGAKLLVEAGVMDNVEQVFGLHVSPNVPVGVIALASGPLTAASDTFALTIKGRGAHSSTPDLAVDPILIGSEIVTNLHHIVARNVSPLENVVISIGEFSSGKTANVIPETARIQGSVRTNDPKIRQAVKKRIEEVIAGICQIYGADYELDYLLGYSSVVNDSMATAIVREGVSKVIGQEQIYRTEPIMGGEDFSAYTDVRPGCFFFMGAGSTEDGYSYPPHHPKFRIDERCLMLGTAMHVEIALAALASGD